MDRGIVQVANHNELPGKKAWTWGQGEYGRLSMMDLGDKNPEYIEVQSGPLQTQSDYGMLAPGASVSWKEYWFPVHGLNSGFEYATDKIAIQTTQSENKIGINMISTEIIKGVNCILLNDGKEIQRKKTDLSPLASVTLEMNKARNDTVTIQLKKDNGNLIAEFISPLPLPKVNPIPTPSYVMKEDATLSVEEKYLKAQKYDRAMDRVMAMKYYIEALSVDSLHLASLRDLAILDFEQGLYEDAEKCLEKALNQIPNDDGLAWYFLGLCHIKKNEFDKAAKCGFKASKCQGTEARGLDLVGKSFMLNNNYKEAKKYFLKAWNSDLNDAGIFHDYLITLVAMGESEEAITLAIKRIEEYSTELTPRFVLILSDPKNGEDIKKIRDFVGEDDFEILETSLTFSRLGLYKEAIQVLESACIDPVPAEKRNHLIQYQLAYLNHLNGNNSSAREYLRKASANYSDFINASHPEMEYALNYALQIMPDDALASYQLGNLYANFGRLEEAEKFWNKAVSSNPTMSIPWRNLGLYYWVVKNDHEKSVSCYQHAINARPYDQTLYRDMAKVLVDNNKRPEAIILLEKMKYKGSKRSDVIIDLAQYYLDDEKYDACSDLLTSVPYFVNWEGSSITWDIFNMANVKKGVQLYEKGDYKSALKTFQKALTFPETLGVGQSSRTEEAMAWFWKGKTFIKLDKPTEAMQAWKSGASTSNGSDQQNYYKKLCNDLQK